MTKVNEVSARQHTRALTTSGGLLWFDRSIRWTGGQKGKAQRMLRGSEQDVYSREQSSKADSGGRQSSISEQGHTAKKWIE